MSKQTIVIIDYAMGNIASVYQALKFVSPEDNIILSHNKAVLLSADKIVFPGQGAIAACVDVLYKYDLVDTIKQCAQEKPFLGICLGLQLLFDHSEENNGTQGLGILTGKVKKFPRSGLKIPHMGWNTVKQTQNHPLWHGITQNSRFYSVHSYFVQTQDVNIVAGSSDYGLDFVCAVAKEKIFAVQFHPEKSQENGLILLKNFTSW